jgi:hypothetical protein
VFRADLFDQTNAPPETSRAPLPPSFDGIEPCDRHWKPEIKRDPTSWLAVQLGDLAALLERSGIAVAGDAALERDAAALRKRRRTSSRSKLRRTAPTRCAVTYRRCDVVLNEHRPRLRPGVMTSVGQYAPLLSRCRVTSPAWPRSRRV